MHEFNKDDSLLRIGSKPLNHGNKIATTYHVKGSDFYFFVIKNEVTQEKSVRIFKLRDPFDEVDDALDVLLLANQVKTEVFLDEFSKYAESVIFNLELFTDA